MAKSKSKPSTPIASVRRKGMRKNIPTEGLRGIDWVIAGGESGPGARPMKPSWVTDIRDQCLAMGVVFFFKQWGGVNKKAAGRELDGRTWDELPQATVPRARRSVAAELVYV